MDDETTAELVIGELLVNEQGGVGVEAGSPTAADISTRPDDLEVDPNEKGWTSSDIENGSGGNARK